MSSNQLTTAEFLAGTPTRLPLTAVMIAMAFVEAEDIVQDVWLRWQATDRSVVEKPPAFLATTTTRMCINFAQSAQSRRETYIGSWLPEPVDTSSDPSLGAERGEALKLAVLILLENFLPLSAPRTFCVKHSTIPTVRSLRFYRLRKQMPDSSPLGRVNM